MGIIETINDKVIKPTIKALGNIINYQQNDPSTPDLVTQMEIPKLPNPCPPFDVLGFIGAEGVPGSPASQAADVYTTITLSLSYVQGKLQRPIIRWPALTKLIANPRAGKMFNAYYDRYYLNFFYDTDPGTSQMIYTADSTDVVAHELGHAILDAIRPDLWGVQCVEIQAFHEAFGDINAILLALTLPNMIHKMLAETGGDLKQPNVIAHLAEQMGVAIYHAMGNAPDAKVHALRNANNTFVFAIPETLPTITPPDQLGGEPHSFSRVFTGAWYDALSTLFNAEKATKSPENALASARDKMARVIYNAVRFAPVQARFFQGVLNAMMVYDQQNNIGCTDAIKAGFGSHGIIANQHFTMTDYSSPSTNKVGIIDTQFGVETVRLSDFTSNKKDPLHNCLVELAVDQSTNSKDITTMSNMQEAINSARHSLEVISKHERVQEGPPTNKSAKEFSIIDGRLIRNYYSCGCRR